MKRIWLLSAAGIGLSVAGAFGLSVAQASMFEPVGATEYAAGASYHEDGQTIEPVVASVANNLRESQEPILSREVLMPADVAVFGLYGQEVPSTGDESEITVAQNSPTSGTVVYPMPPNTAGADGDQGLQSLWLLGVFR